MRLITTCLFLVPVFAACLSAPPEDPQLGSTNAGQSAADTLRDFTNADAALVPAELISKPVVKADLSAMLLYPDEGFTVIEVTGAELKQALERSVSLYPDPNVGFLQISGIDVTFSKKAPANARVTSVTLGGSKLDDAKTYAVAMPASLQRGQLGYSDLWEKAKIVHSFPKGKLQDVLKGKHVAQGSPHWVAQD